MKVILNGQITEQSAILNPNNRAFQYGDGLFETIIFHDKHLRFFSSHIDRLSKGAELLKLNHEFLDEKILSEAILNLIKENSFSDSCRIKIMLWRQADDSRGYSTDTMKSELLIAVKPSAAPTIRTLSKVGFSERVKLVDTAYSRCKTISALPYIMAGIERDELELDEIIISDCHRFISECVSSNIFWIKNNVLFTSPLSTGCIEGVMRKQIIDLFKKTDHPAQEIKISKEDLLKQDLIFSSNVTGLSIFKSIDGISLATEHQLIQEIKQQLVL